jgi:hypothetical protein
MKTLHKPLALNTLWHMRHRMPPGATIEQRIAWHEAHVHNCSCRPMPVRLVEAAKRYRGRAAARVSRRS